MANREHLEIIMRGVDAWNKWRLDEENYDILADLSGADLHGANLQRVKLNRTDLSDANFSEADLYGAFMQHAIAERANFDGACLESAFLERANLSGASFRRARLFMADLTYANLDTANLESANLVSAKIVWANLRKANLRKADLSRVLFYNADLTETDFSGANLVAACIAASKLQNALLVDCDVFGCSVWGVDLKGAKQSGLRIIQEHPYVKERISVQNIEAAQFIHMLLGEIPYAPGIEEHRIRIHEVFDAIASKLVLLLGNFEQDGDVLSRISTAIKIRNYVPVIFDFDVPRTKDITGTVEILARLACFVVADLTNPSSVPHELATLVPYLRRTPVAPIRRVGARGYSMFSDFLTAYDKWVLPVIEYEDLEALIKDTLDKVIDAAQHRADELQRA